MSQSSSSVIGAGREQRGHGASVASLSITRLCAAHSATETETHSCSHLSLPSTSVGGSITKLPCYVLHDFMAYYGNEYLFA